MPSTDWEKRRRFAAVYAATGNAARAARAAGVPPASARVVGHQWLRNPDVLELLRTEIDTIIRALAPPALAAMRRLIEDEETPPQVRLAASRDVLDRIGLVPPKRAELAMSLGSKRLGELTVEELTLIARSGEASSSEPLDLASADLAGSSD